jgi:hypothetical protein
MRLAIEGNLLGLPRLERPAKAATYLKLFTGSQSPVDDKTLIPAAVEIMDMFKIPSVDVAKAFPKLELLYTDMVRHELPYLAQLMRLRQLYTLPDFVRASTRILRSDEEVGLRKKLQAPTSDLLRTEEGKNTTALLLASIFRVSAADIMAAKGFAPESVIKGAPTTPPPPPAQIQPGAATVG